MTAVFVTFFLLTLPGVFVLSQWIWTGILPAPAEFTTLGMLLVVIVGLTDGKDRKEKPTVSGPG